MLFPKPGSAATGPQLGPEEIQLKSGHLIFGQAIASRVFGEELQAKLAFDEQKQCFVIGRGSMVTIKMRYPKPSPMIVKQKNAHGEVSIAIQEWILDHNINPETRSLASDWEERVQLLTVTLQ